MKGQMQQNSCLLSISLNFLRLIFLAALTDWLCSFGLFLADELVWGILGSIFLACQGIYVVISAAWGQFHQCSTSSFCTHRSQKPKKDWQLDCFFALSGSACRKVACKTLMKLTPDVEQTNRDKALSIYFIYLCVSHQPTDHGTS